MNGTGATGAGPRLLFLSPVGTIGGAERVLLDLLTGVRTGLPDASLTLLCGGEGSLLEAARDLGVSARAVPLPAAAARLGDSPDSPGDTNRGGAQSRVARLARFAAAGPAVTRGVLRWRAAIRAERPDLIHSNGLKTHLLTAAALAGRRAGRRPPVVWAVHDFYSERPLAGRALRRAGRGVSALACVSAAVERDALTLLPNAATRVILNGVDLTRFAPCPEAGDGAALDAAAGLPPAPAGTLRVGLAATYARWKGQDVLIEAAARLRARRPDLAVRWFVVGGPIYATAAQWTRGELEALAERAGVADAVGFVPFQSDMPAAYRALDVAVHASVRREPFGLTIAEAMACGRPTIVAAAGGAAELFTDGEDALGHSPGDAVALAVAVERLADDPARRARLGAAARRTAERRFDRDRVGSQYAALYSELLGAHAAPGRGET
ncbi:glycosyltransferase family 4 protein [Alienimonas californiensis]|uniref:GDP-mannose-dependent alpha-(1-6)-phosphatidylinositol monomannoside mannosyltransferase n=1 Tax=Alienimonas californiensis TaxID=2527989 RepID=A0A517P7Y6_9PLAN|nr:glycosyltransferase family 4 protein [Alienimonas californiensis]QDT15494.1 GDP-mannose-dependent alpha-(1-6)-phosphatidylinositol monomannoside mannosyltransferase [Alienimonas californiensis]